MAGFFDNEVGRVFIDLISSPLAWLGFLFIFAIVILAWLWFRKKRAFKFNGFEITDYGINTGIKCGWIGRKTYLKGLWWSGREVMQTNLNEEILNYSEEDFIEIDGQRAVMFYRSPTTRQLVPINRFVVKGKEMVAQIPPAEFIDSAIDIVKDATKETSDWKQQLLMFAAWAFVVLFALVGIILVTQMVQKGQTEASKLIVEAGNTCLTNAKEICSEIANTMNGNAP